MCSKMQSDCWQLSNLLVELRLEEARKKKSKIMSTSFDIRDGESEDERENLWHEFMSSDAI